MDNYIKGVVRTPQSTQISQRSVVVGVWESSVSLPVSEISAPGDVQQTSQHLHGYLYCSLRMGGYNSVYFHFAISL